MADTTINRQIVQEGLDARAEARSEATQEAQDAIFLAELNKITAANQRTAELLQAAQRRVRAQRREQWKEQRKEEAEATRRDSFMQRIFTALLVIAATILLHNIQAVAFWLAATIGITGLLYIIVSIWCYYGIDRKRKKEANHG